METPTAFSSADSERQVIVNAGKQMG